MTRKYASIFLLFLVAVLLSPVVALAQEANTSVNGGSLFAIVQPYVVELASVIVAFIVAWVSAKVTKLTGIQIEAKHREALQSALQNGVNYGINKAGGWAATKDFDLKNQALAAAVKYVLDSVPDAIAHFGLTPEKLAQLLEAKLPQYGELISGAAAIDPPASNA